MSVGCPMAPLELSEDEVNQLHSLAGSRSLPHAIVQRAQMVLACAAGDSNTAVAKRFGVRGSTVGKWRQRYLELGLEGLHDELRPARQRTYEDDTVAEVINRALQTRPPDGSTHWSARTLAAATGISKTTVHRWLQTFSVQPHRQKTYRFEEDARIDRQPPWRSFSRDAMTEHAAGSSSANQAARNGGSGRPGWREPGLLSLGAHTFFSRTAGPPMRIRNTSRAMNRLRQRRISAFESPSSVRRSA